LETSPGVVLTQACKAQHQGQASPATAVLQHSPPHDRRFVDQLCSASVSAWCWAAGVLSGEDVCVSAGKAMLAGANTPRQQTECL